MEYFIDFCCVFERTLKRSVSAGCWLSQIFSEEVDSATLGVLVDAVVVVLGLVVVVLFVNISEMFDAGITLVTVILLVFC